MNSRILISFTEPSSLFLWCTSCPWLCLWKSLLAGSCILVCPIILSALLYFVSQLAYTCLATSWNQPFLQGVLIPFNCLVGFRNQDLCSWCTHCIWSVTASKSSQLTETGNKCVCVCVCVCVWVHIPGSGKCPGGGHGNPLQYICLENPHGQRSLAGYSP